MARVVTGLPTTPSFADQVAEDDRAVAGYCGSPRRIPGAAIRDSRKTV